MIREALILNLSAHCSTFIVAIIVGHLRGKSKRLLKQARGKRVEFVDSKTYQKKKGISDIYQENGGFPSWQSTTILTIRPILSVIQEV